MRLLIAGILTLIIFLMICAFDNEKKETSKVEKNKFSIYSFPPQQEEIHLNLYYFHQSDLKIHPPFVYEESHHAKRSYNMSPLLQQFN